MLSALTLSAPAKLNLFLHIVGQQANGYHQLQTIFQLLDYGDTLTFRRKMSGGIRLTCSNQNLESDDNLILRAARALEKTSGQILPVEIHLNKVLPMGGGIGGGSSDCATTLLGLNYLFELNLSIDQLTKIGAELGADVPVFVAGKSAWAEGIGEHLTPLTLPQRWYCVLHPQVHVSTAELFRHPKLTRNTPTSKIRPALAEDGHNDFEPLVRQLYPEIDHAFHISSSFGKARLTGTGACLFLSFDSKAAADDALTEITQRAPDLSGFIARSVQTSPVFEQLKSASRE